MRYMGLDLGSKSLGLSISLSGIIANPYDTFYFTENNYDEAALIMIDILKKEQIDVLVIGLPKHMNNDEGIRAQISRDFKKKLEDKIKIEIKLIDERLTTKEALKSLSLQGKKKDRQRSQKDKVAAIIILQNYLNQIGG